jgi:hypothetical protein
MVIVLAAWSEQKKPFQLSELGNHLTNAKMVHAEKGYHLWGSSPVIGEDGKVHLFTARWPVKKGARNNGFDPYWRIDGHIAHYVGESETGPFYFSDVAARTESETFWSPHNPTIHKVDDQFVLLFIVNTGGLSSSQRIVMYLSESVYGPWRPAKSKKYNDGTILERPENPEVWCHTSIRGVSNPAFIHANNKFYVFYKSNSEKYRQTEKHANSIYGVAVADNLEGPYVHHKNPVSDPSKSIEDAYAFYVDNTFYLVTTDHLNHFKTSDSGHYSNAGMVMWMSEDPYHFPLEQVVPVIKPIAEYVDIKKAKDLKQYRGIKFERPQFLTNEVGFPVRFYAPVGFNPEGGDGTVVYSLEVTK